MDKPLIRFFDGYWFCWTATALGVSDSPSGAYWSAVSEH